MKAETGVSEARPFSAAHPLALAHGLSLRFPLLVACDFDGTISRIVTDPWGATVLPQAQVALRRLAGTPGVHVALVSGRRVPDVASRARIGGATYLGNHGAERGWLPRGGRASAISVEQRGPDQPYRDLAATLAAAVPLRIREPWLVVEEKGPAVAFHFRAAPDIDEARARISAAIDELDPEPRFERFTGRRVMELRPPGAPDKGEALAVLIDELQPAYVVAMGDDLTDGDGFRVLREARSAGRLDGIALAVDARGELGPKLIALADAVLGSPAEAARFLASLERQVRRQLAGNATRRPGASSRPSAPRLP